MVDDIDIRDSFGNRVCGILSLPEGVSSVVVMSHGYSSNKDSKIYRDLENELNAEGIGTLRYDYYGHGPAYGFKGPGYGVSNDVTLSKTVESLKAMLKYLRERCSFNIGLLGSSFGGLISLVVASQQQDIKALVLKSPVTEPIRFWRQRIKKNFGEGGFEQWKRDGKIHYSDRFEDYDLVWDFWADLQGYDTLGDARNVACPTLIVHAEKDTYVPISQSYELAEVLGEEVKVIPGVDHGYSDLKQYNEVKKLLKDFILKVF